MFFIFLYFYVYFFQKKHILITHSKIITMVEKVYKRIQQLNGREIRAKVHTRNRIVQMQGIVSDVSNEECCIGHKPVRLCDIEPSSLEEV